MNSHLQFVAFNGVRKIASGDLREVALKAQKTGSPNVLIFDDNSSEVVDLDLNGTPRELSRRIESVVQLSATVPVGLVPRTAVGPHGRPDEATEAPRAPGRPKLGVVAREVTLLPRHWEWLNLQPGGASVALRKLVDEARRSNRESDRVRLAKEAVYRFVSAMAGNEEGFEEAIRGLFAGDAVRFVQHSRTWPEDVREHAAQLAERAWEEHHE